jgi:hypothetical protein
MISRRSYASLSETIFPTHPLINTLLSGVYTSKPIPDEEESEIPCCSLFVGQARESLLSLGRTKVRLYERVSEWTRPGDVRGATRGENTNEGSDCALFARVGMFGLVRMLTPNVWPLE